MHLFGDLAVGVPEREQRQDLAFAAAELLGRRVGIDRLRGGLAVLGEPEREHIGHGLDQAQLDGCERPCGCRAAASTSWPRTRPRARIGAMNSAPSPNFAI